MTEGRLSDVTMARKGGREGGNLEGYPSNFESLGLYPGPESSAAAKALEVAWLWSYEGIDSSAGGENVNACPTLPAGEGAGAISGTVHSAAKTGA